MPGICERVKDWVTSPFTAVVKFQKEFVDEAKENLKQQQESYTRWQRELQERAVQLHLDELEGQFLCCVCGRSGVDRDENHFASDTFSIITLPSKQDIRKAVRATERAVAAERRRKEREERNAWAGNANNESDSDDDSDTASTQSRTTLTGSPSVSSAVGSPLESASMAKKKQRAEEEEAAKAKAKARRRKDRERRRRRQLREGGVEERAVDRWGPKYADEDDFSSDEETDGQAGGAAGAYEDEDEGSGAAARYRALLDPSTVGPTEIRTLMYNIRHAVLNKEARGKRSSEHTSRDQGLTMLDDKEIETFSRLFKRPVHGYLCEECHTSAKRRVDTLVEEMKSLLFRAEHPLLHKLPHRELYAWLSTGQISPLLAGSILHTQEEWEQLSRRHRAHADEDDEAEEAGAERRAGDVGSAGVKDQRGGRVGGAGAVTGTANMDTATRRLRQAIARANADDASRAASQTALEVELDVLPDDVIFKLREFVSCGVCTRRRACFFVRRSVLFTCQFCCARDRFYRDNAVCLNDEPMPAETRLLLCELAVYYETVRRQQHLRQLPQTELVEAPTNLFSTATHTDLFEQQAPPETERLVSTRPHFVPRGWRQRHPREAASRSMVSLFEGNTLVAGARAPVSAVGARHTAVAVADELPSDDDGSTSAVTIVPVPLSLGANCTTQLFQETSKLGDAISRSQRRRGSSLSHAQAGESVHFETVSAPGPAPSGAAAAQTLDMLFAGEPTTSPTADLREAEAQAAREAEAQAAREAEAQAAREAEAQAAREAEAQAAREAEAQAAREAEAQAAREAEAQAAREAEAQAAREAEAQAAREAEAQAAREAEAQAAREAEAQAAREAEAQAAREAEAQAAREAEAQAAREAEALVDDDWDPLRDAPWVRRDEAGAAMDAAEQSDSASSEEAPVQVQFNDLDTPQHLLPAVTPFDVAAENLAQAFHTHAPPLFTSDPFATADAGFFTDTQAPFYNFGSGAPSNFTPNQYDTEVSPAVTEPSNDDSNGSDQSAPQSQREASPDSAQWNADAEDVRPVPNEGERGSGEEEISDEDGEDDVSAQPYPMTGPPEWF